jgi:GNAT superfamily N-acetyltransferase
MMVAAVIDARRYRAEDTLPDGRAVLVRAIEPADREELRDGFRRLSEQSVYLRFFQRKRELSEEELSYFTRLDFVHHVALVALLEEDGQELGVAVGRYVVDDGQRDSAEVAITVDDAHQGIGIGKTLMKHLAKVARANGIATFRATVLSENRRMLDTIAHSGYLYRSRMVGGAFEVVISLTEEAMHHGHTPR